MDLRLSVNEAHGLNLILWTAIFETMRELSATQDDEIWKLRLRMRMEENYSPASVSCLEHQARLRGSESPINAASVRIGLNAFETALRSVGKSTIPLSIDPAKTP